MSAYVVSESDIDVLVQAITTLGYWSSDTAAADELGSMLLEECFRSVEYRYPNDPSRDSLPGPVPMPKVEEYRYVEPVMGPDDGLNSIRRQQWNIAARHYQYQSCEHPGWEKSEAAGLVEALMKVTPHTEADYSEGSFPWGYAESDVHPDGRAWD